MGLFFSPLPNRGGGGGGAHEEFDKFITFDETVGAFVGSILVEGLHAIRLDAWIVDGEGNGLGGVRT